MTASHAENGRPILRTIYGDQYGHAVNGRKKHPGGDRSTSYRLSSRIEAGLGFWKQTDLSLIRNRLGHAETNAFFTEICIDLCKDKRLEAVGSAHSIWGEMAERTGFEPVKCAGWCGLVQASPAISRTYETGGTPRYTR